MFASIVFGCISNKGWTEDKKCIYNNDGSACRLGNLVGLVGCFGAIALLALEAFFQNISSIKVRRRAVAADMGFSAAWAGLNFIVFAYLGIQWGKSPPPLFGEGINNARAVIAFALLSIPVWAGCAYFAWIRWQSGADMGQFVGEEGQQPGAEYSAYPADGQDYQDGQQAAPGNNPFAAGADYQAPAY